MPILVETLNDRLVAAIAWLLFTSKYPQTAAAEVIVYSFPNMTPKFPEGEKLTPIK